MGGMKFAFACVMMCFLCCCGYHAPVHPAPPLVAVPMSAASPYEAHGFGYRLRGSREKLPDEHKDFTRLPGYPHTFSVWMNRELLQQPGKKSVCIELAKQRGLCLVDGVVAMDFPVCTGRGRKRTPKGVFHIKQKHIDHHSNLYDCPMPYFMRLTWGGIGMHVGDVYRSPASHGCIRLPQVACEPLYHALPYGTKVVVE